MKSALLVTLSLARALRRSANPLMALSRSLKCLSIGAFLLTACRLHAVVLDYNNPASTANPLNSWVTRINLPDDLPEIRGLVIIGNGAGGSSIGSAGDAELVAFARAHGFGIMAFGRWSNLYSSTERNRFLAALADFATRANRPELLNVPWVAFGFSNGGGQAYSLNYHFPERTIAIGVNKAGYSYLYGGNDTGRLDQTGPFFPHLNNRPASPNALKTPALLVAGALDDLGRITNVTNAFKNNRAQGAPWAMLIEEGVGHERGRAYHWILPFLAEAITLRYPTPMSALAGAPDLLDVDQTMGWLIDQSTQSTRQLQVQSEASFSGNTTQRLARGWVPSEGTARRAQAFGSYGKVGSLTAGSTTTATTLSAAPLDLVYGVDLSSQTSPAWTKIEFFNGGSGALGEVFSGVGNTPSWTRRVTTSSGFVSTYGRVTRSDATQRYTPLQTMWVNSDVKVPGLLGEYFDYTSPLAVVPNLQGRRPDLVRFEQKIDFANSPTAWSGLPATMIDTFAARFSGKIQIPKTGDYTFSVTSDDGSELWIDGQLVVSHGGIHPMTERQGTVPLAAGAHDIKLLYFENTGWAGLALRWQGPGIGKQIIPASALFTVLSPGINAEYFDHSSALSAIPAMENLTPQLTLIEDQLNEPSVYGAWTGLPSSMQDTFSSRYNGFIRVEQPGTYRFHLASDDGSSLRINGAQLLMNNRLQSMTENSTVAVELQAGWHHFWIEYFENYGNAGLVFSWTPPSGSKQVIPAGTYFRPTQK